MAGISDYISAEDRVRISGAVAQAENHTAGEIVTVFAERSDDYLDIALAWSSFVALTAMVVIAFFPDFYLGLYDLITGSWMRDWTPQGLLTFAATVGTLKFTGMMLLQMWMPLRLFLVPGFIKAHRARTRAVLCFKVGAERRTHGRTGILIYLSMQEHRAEIVADEAIATLVPDETWGSAMAAMIGPVRDGQVADGIIAAVEQVGAVLAAHFPRDANDVNELPDRLIEL
jgi:putative membrane protein